MKTRRTLTITRKHSLYPVLNELAQAHESDLAVQFDAHMAAVERLTEKEQALYVAEDLAREACEDLRDLMLNDSPTCAVEEARRYFICCEEAWKAADAEFLAADAAVPIVRIEPPTIPGATFIDRTPSGALILEITNPAMWGEAIAEGHTLREAEHMRREARVQHQFNALSERARLTDKRRAA